MRGNDLIEHRAFWAGVTVGLAGQEEMCWVGMASVGRLPGWERSL